MPKLPLFLIALITIVGAALFIYLQNPPKKSEIYKPGQSYDQDTAVNQAQFLYSQRKQAGVDFSSGPCLSNSVISGWVVDIAHSPRLPIDDLPENQCTAYLQGSAKHFVELDPEGNVIRVK